MREWLDAAVALLLAPACGACHAPLRHPTRGCICQDCWDAVLPFTVPTCARCGEPLDSRLPDAAVVIDGSPLPRPSVCLDCRGAHSAIDAARAVGPHAGALRGIVHALKYDARRSIAPQLAALMRRAASGLIASSDVAVPVPLHPFRQRARGFNQADDLARHVGLPVVHALRRRRHTATQTALPASERHANMAEAFAPTRRAASLSGCAVLLVDDVMTTGATLEACARTLKEAGVREVRALTAARAERPGA